LTEGAKVEKHGVELDAARPAATAASGIITIHGNLFDSVVKSESFSSKTGGRRSRSRSPGKSMSGRDLGSWIGRAEQKGLLRAIAAGGLEHFALTLADFELPATGAPIAG
jgi:hypothetical protein